MPAPSSGDSETRDHAGLSSGSYIGIDEAGRGCLAGPVIAAAALFPQDFPFDSLLPGLTDSKRLREPRRCALAEGVAVHATAYGLGLSWQDEIDAVNILNATFRAMTRAVLDLAAKLRAEASNRQTAAFRTTDVRDSLPRLLIDGNQTIPQFQWEAGARSSSAADQKWGAYFPYALSVPPFPIQPLPDQRAVINGDALVPAISAASVLAKTVRDALMLRLDAVYPGYGMARHKGYGTQAHLSRIAEKGPCELHRATFRGVKAEGHL